MLLPAIVSPNFRTVVALCWRVSELKHGGICVLLCDPTPKSASFVGVTNVPTPGIPQGGESSLQQMLQRRLR